MHGGASMKGGKEEGKKKGENKDREKRRGEKKKKTREREKQSSTAAQARFSCILVNFTFRFEDSPSVPERSYEQSVQ